MFLNFLLCQDCPNRVKFCNACSLNRGPGGLVNHAVQTVHCYEWFEWTTRIDVGRNHMREVWKALDYLYVHIISHFMIFHAFQELVTGHLLWGVLATRWTLGSCQWCLAIQGCATTHFFLGNHKLTFFCCLGVPKIYAISIVTNRRMKLECRKSLDIHSGVLWQIGTSRNKQEQTG